MTDLAQHIRDLGNTLNRVKAAELAQMPQRAYSPDTTYADMHRAVAASQSVAHALIEALRPFVESYEAAADPIGDSDLYPEQPRHVLVTLGDCRRAASVLRNVKR